MSGNGFRSADGRRVKEHRDKTPCNCTTTPVRLSDSNFHATLTPVSCSQPSASRQKPQIPRYLFQFLSEPSQRRVRRAVHSVTSPVSSPRQERPSTPHSSPRLRASPASLPNNNQDNNPLALTRGGIPRRASLPSS